MYSRACLVFICFHSEETPKGTECFETFKTMQDCFAEYPAVYDKSSDGTASGDDADLDAALAESESSASANNNVESVDQLDETPMPSTSSSSIESSAKN